MITFKEINKKLSTNTNDTPKENISIFYFTVNSNKASDDILIDDWKDQQRKLWGSDVYYLLKTTNKYEGLGPFSLVPKDKLKNIDVQIAFEIGGSQNRLHLHGIVKVTHFTKLQLNYSNIHEVLRDLTGINSNQYFHSIVKHDDIINFVDYMSKVDVNIEKYKIDN